MRGNPSRKWLTAYVVLFLLFIYLPVSLLPIFSFNDSIYVAFPFKGFTTDWYTAAAQNGQLLKALTASMKVGIIVALLSTFLGYLAARAVTRYAIPGKGVLIGFMMLPLVAPPLVLGLALLILFRGIADLELSLVTIGAGQVMLCLPLSMLIMLSRLESFDRSLEEAAIDLGDNSLEVTYRVILPLIWPALLSSVLLCFTASFDEYVIAAFLSGTDTTLPVYIFSQLRFPQKLPSVLAVGSCILLLSIVLVVVAEVLLRGSGEKSHVR